MSAYVPTTGGWSAPARAAVSPVSDAAPSHAIRAACPADVTDILALISPHVAAGTLLPRSADQILSTLDQWVVVERPDGILVGCGSLVRYNGALAELRSLVVARPYHGHGIGREIVVALLERARALGVHTVFTLTRVEAFFARLGFAPAALEQFPEKARLDCALCPRQHCCDEQALVIHLNPLQ